jgi:uncharacterized protein YkwD
MLAHVSRHLRRGSRRSFFALLALAITTTVVTLLPQSATAAAYHQPSHKRSSYESTVARSVLDHLNIERKAHHLPTLVMSNALDASARRHNVTMAYWNEMSHQLPREAYFATRISQEGYHWSWAGENVAWNSLMSEVGVLRLQGYMYNERPPNDGHRQNILSSHYRNVGIDVYVDSQHHKMWLTEDFGAH